MSRHRFCPGCRGVVPLRGVCPRCGPARSEKERHLRAVGTRTGSTRAWRKLRERALVRDGHRCTYRDPATEARCSETAASLARRGLALEADHIIPRSAGGPDALWNLRTRCPRHNPRIGRASLS